MKLTREVNLKERKLKLNGGFMNECMCKTQGTANCPVHKKNSESNFWYSKDQGEVKNVENDEENQDVE